MHPGMCVIYKNTHTNMYYVPFVMETNRSKKICVYFSAATDKKKEHARACTHTHAHTHTHTHAHTHAPALGDWAC